MDKGINVEPFMVMDSDIDLILDLDASLQRLLNNPDFKKVFVNHYLGTYVLEKKDLLTRSDVRGGVMEALVATAYFKSYITNIHMRAVEYKTAKKQVDETETTTPFGED